MFEDIKQTHWITLVLFWIADVALAAMAVGLFASGALKPLAAATGGLFNETLLANLPALVIEIGIVMLWLTRLRTSDIGLIWSQLWTGLAITAGLWGLVQIIELAVGLAQNGIVALNVEWTTKGVTAMLGALIAQIFGNALREEVGYRGFLLPQLYLMFTGIWHTRLRLITALILSQAAFALMHIPIGLYARGQVNGFELLRLFIFGAFFAIIYLRTQNLFLAIGVHALGNAPTSLLLPVVDPSLLLILFTIILLFLWSIFGRRREYEVE